MKILLATCFVVLLATLSFAEETISPKEAWKLGWPTMQGPYGNYRVPQTGVKLVDDLSKAFLISAFSLRSSSIDFDSTVLPSLSATFFSFPLQPRQAAR